MVRADSPTPRQIDQQTATSHKIALIMLMAIVGASVVIAATLALIGRRL